MKIKFMTLNIFLACIKFSSNQQVLVSRSVVSSKNAIQFFGLKEADSDSGVMSYLSSNLD